MGYPETAEGFMIRDQKKWSEFHKEEFKLKTFEDYDVDIAIDACGVCGSDVHTITGGWGDCPLPICVGHEVVGRALKVGSKVKTVKVGDRVGVGAQIGADFTCANCKSGQENYCVAWVDTYGSEYKDGVISQGGFASHIRAHEHFTFKIPDNVETAIAAPMLCAGITTYSPLVRLGCGPGKKVAVVGIGGLGHFGILWAAALGAEVTAISSSENKKADAEKLGAKNFICSKTKDWHKPYAMHFDLILNCSNMLQKMNIGDYLSTLKVNCTFQNVGMPDEPIQGLKAQDFASNGCYIGTSHIGNREEMIAMFELASKQNIKSWVETISIGTKGCKEAVERVKENKVHYRFTLVDYDKEFGKRE